MEKWTVEQDERRPHEPPPPRRLTPWFAALGFGAVAWVAALGYRHFIQDQASDAAPPPFATPTEVAAVPAPPQPPPVRHRIEAPPATAALPALDKSDALARRALSTLMGRKTFDRYMVPDQLVRRVVATVDNLPRRTAPARTLPLTPVPGRFATTAGAEGAIVDASNFDRYLPYVRVLERLEPRPLVQVYARAYPLFQRAYEELGFPGRYFNDRLVEAIDDMLEAPELDGPVPLMREKVLYQYADEDLETRSAGQKILMRMGPANARRVKAKLTQIRAEILAASKPPR